MAKREYGFSRHYREDNSIDPGITIDCINTGRKTLDEEPNKFKARKEYRKGELIAVYRDYGDFVYVITAFWNKRGG